ncbi:hypothetical protein NW768_006723 [Fusarium equiseti]|uniref:CHAT domain-containing protein n=1 Tax=Fusarium equiseti TaxID=61235 RepID=A0ABQ8R961_FUSEQ|nr:hypothetical protein NW768_006723 [Fusarium equiseti]
MDNTEYISGADLTASLHDTSDSPHADREVDLEALVGNGTIEELNTAIDICQCVEEFEEHEPIKAKDKLVTHLLNSPFIERNEVLEQVIQLSRELYEDRAVVGDHILLSCRADNYSKALGHRYWHRGSSDDLFQAIELSEEAVAASPQATSILHNGIVMQQPSSEVHTLNTLAARLGERFQLTESMDCLNRSIHVLERLLSAVHGPKWDADRSNWSSNLASLLQRRYEQIGGDSTADIDRSIDLSRQTLRAMNENEGSTPKLLLDLGNAIAGRALATRNAADLDQAITLLRAARIITQATGLEGTEVGYNLALRLFQRHGVNDIDQAILIAESTLGSLPEEHPVWPHLQNLLGALCYEQYVEEPSPARARKVVELSRTALDSSHYPSVLYRVQAGRRVLRLCCELHDWQAAYEAAVTAIGLIPKLSMREIRNSDRQRILSADDVVGFSSDAAAAALNAGKSGYEVVKLLEMGRGSLASSVAELRTDITSLRQEHPVEAERFVELRNQLGADSHGQASASQEFDTLLSVIRQKPGFENFLKPPTYQSILDAAVEGPIVMLNQSKHRRGIDAIILKGDGIHTTNLQFSLEDISVSPGYLQDPTFLAHLWDSIVKPILESTGIGLPSTGNLLPRIWWIPIGALGSLPFHAAGRHFAAVADSVMDRAVSSYSSSIRGLLETRKRPSTLPQSSEDRAFLVGMSITPTPGCADLPYAIEEVQTVKGIFEDSEFRCRLLLNATALKQNVLEHLTNCAIFHFAGHAMEDALDPLRSTLLLHDNETDPMTVEDLLEVNLSEQSPYLAFLAACKTGSITRPQFQDQSIHLVAAYQLAGFRHVIGSLWSVEDQVSMTVATGTYMELLPAMTEGRVSRSLHAVTRELRDRVRVLHGVESTNQSRDIILVDDKHDNLGREEGNWVPFVHFGI